MNILISFSYLIGFIVVVYFINEYDKRKYVITSEETGKETIDKRQMLSYFLVFLSIILGMAATTLFDALSSGGFSNLNSFSVTFLASIMVSPIIMRLTINDITDLKFGTFLIGFQNGFFWQTIFDKLS